MAGDPTARSGPQIEIQRVHQAKADEVTDRIARHDARLPVDHARGEATREQDVAHPEVSMDRASGDPIRAKAGPKRREPLEIGLQFRISGETGSQTRDHALANVERS